MTEQINVPKLRFVDFSNTWRNEKLGNVVEINSGDSPSKFKLVEEGIPFFKVEQLNNSTKYQTDSIYFINEPKKVISKGSVIFPKRGASILLNKIRILKQPSFMDTNLMTLTANEQLNNEYLYYFILREDLSTLADTTSIPQINNKHILPYPIALPTLPEQQKIASFLSKVDEKIGLLSEKKDKLTEYKRGVMQQLFNGKWNEQDGQLTFVPPTLRFKADDGSEFPDWEEKKLGDVVSKEKHSFTGGPFGSDLKSDDYTDSGVRIIQLQNIGDGHFNNKYKIYTSESKADALISCNIYPNDLLLSKMGEPVARALLVPNTESRYVMCSDGIRIVPDDSKFNRYFLMSYINSPFFRNKATSVSTGSTRLRIGLTDLRQLKIIAPNIEEQTQIANFLLAIDQKIELTNSELNKAKEWKKGLLQQMFV